MPHTLRIDDKDARGFLAVDLKTLLDVVGDDGATLVWTVQALSVSGTLGDGRSVVELEEESRRPPHGLVMSWNDLTSLASRLTQVQDGVFAGCAAQDQIPAAGDDEALYRQTEIVLEAIDSSFWNVYSSDQNLLKRFRERFRSTRMVSEP